MRIKLSFCQIVFGMNVKGYGNPSVPSAAKGVGKITNNGH